jgi:hypothetical protein
VGRGLGQAPQLGVSAVGILLTYAGLIIVAIGACSVVVPLKFLRIRTRRVGAAVAGIGILVVSAGLLLPPPPLHRSERSLSRIDAFMPEFQFSEFHQRRVRAAPSQVLEAIRAVTAQEIPLFRLLTGIRHPSRFFRKEPDHILNPPAARPILEVATTSGFFVLAEEPEEIVIGTYLARPAGVAASPPEEFASLSEPGYLKAAMNFRVDARTEGTCNLTTETRVLATDPAAARRFATYWRVIYPGSALIRRMWLLAIARRAERDARAD